MKCPEPPTFQDDSPAGEFNIDYIHDPPQYLDVAQFSCPEGFVFEVYDSVPDENGTYALIEDLSSINLTCSDYADWMPLEVPICIRKFYSQFSALRLKNFL